MFSKLVSRNSKRSRKENGLFFSSLLISIIAFYIILSLSQQDVMLFLKKMESDAVDRLMAMIPVFYCMTLFILFFLIYYASKFQLERRRHEFGVYLMLGMRRVKLFAMLMAEDFHSSAVALVIGLPAAILLSELISLITARLVGIGIIGHQITFSLRAAVWTAAGFLGIKLAAFLILSGKISRQEIGSLLAEAPEGAKKERPVVLYGLALAAGIFFLILAYGKAISGIAWYQPSQMSLTILLGLLGTFLLFWGLRVPLGFAAKAGRKDKPLHVFNFRQIQGTVIHRSGTLAVCSLLILAALCCFGAGVAIARFYDDSEPHVLDYTFQEVENSEGAEAIRQALTGRQLDTRFSELFEMKVGHIHTTEDLNNAFQMESVMSELAEKDPSDARDVLFNNLRFAGFPHLIALSSYNRLLSAAGLPELKLDADEAAVYMDREFCSDEKAQIMNSILEIRPETRLDGKPLYLTETVQTTNLVTDRSITLSFALILPDEAFEYYTQSRYAIYLDGVLDVSGDENSSLMAAIADMNDELDEAGLAYESYLQNMGRQLFYMVAASYITIYLAIIFLIIANTIIGVQFLMGQQKSSRRYRTLVHLGATYEVLCKSAKKQINWYFGIPTAIAVISSLFSVRALFTGLLNARTQGNIPEMMLISAAMIFALLVVECIYIAAVRRSSSRYLLTLMVPKREE